LDRAGHLCRVFGMKRMAQLMAAWMAGVAVVSCGTNDVPQDPGPDAAQVAPYNALILQTVREMPRGGGYTTSDRAEIALRSSVSGIGGKLRIQPEAAKPSYCSGATYLALLKTVEKLEDMGRLEVSEKAIKALLVFDQPDGLDTWGKWNANGPGAAKVMHDTGMGHNFESWDAALPGDFLKIFWNNEIGRKEFGHLVVYLGTFRKGGKLHVKFWSSNEPHGFGVKSVPREKIQWAIFSRLERPERINRVGALPREDRWLAAMLRESFTRNQVRAQVGMLRK